ncbi:uncharacterized protein FIBRA_05898 [Fibroporia radiculosa]|uniref:Fork-head domain-containing protein n=1 Tax=Fibroporia radiculosa TaxID=599839 RepID=J4HYA2_9APHY|nr:uncharacterized protein FIBRA_05898 [Fibroporia radiculosa]CCM03752.1 predicted protein [Fibroporia radiculosa]
MTSLNNLLNPESSYEYSLRVKQSRSPSGSISSPREHQSDRTSIQENYYGQSNISITPHEPHPNCPDTLACLPNTDGRPQHTLPVILRCAILGSPKKRLTIREIYAAMEKKYPYYKTAGPAWKVAISASPRPSRPPSFTQWLTSGAQQSVRHHLSLNRLFERQPRPATDPGFGSYWTVNLNAPPGTKRPRKRGRANKEAAANSAAVPPPPSIPTAPPPEISLPPPPPPFRGKAQEKTPELKDYHPPPIATLRPVDSRSFSQVSSLRPGEYYDDDDDDEMEWDEEGGRMSDEDYVSSDEMPYKFDPRASTSSTHSLTSPPNRPVLYGAFSGYASAGYRGAESQDPVAERLKMEMAGLRRQSTDAVNASLRMSSQLADAQADAARMRAALKVAESRLDEEMRRRREAEHIAEDEARLRLAAEDALRAYQLQRRPPGYTSSRP